jgi:hypothetical protein
MFRMFAVAAILTVTAATAQAGESLETRIHTAAVKACDARYGNTAPLAFYGSMNKACVVRVSSVTLQKLQSDALARARYTTALAGN